MAMIESTPSRLVLKDRSTTVTFDKTTGHAILQQKILLWSKKPVEFDRFTAVVQAQVKKLGEGGKEVAFRVSVKEGRVTLTANPKDES